ncbi:hypothetical protein EMIT0210MI2_250046 [Priestia megaterium]|nr:hypothetical protein BMG_5806 [Priestia megaterium]
MLAKVVYHLQFKNRKTPVTCSGVFSATFISLKDRNVTAS